MRGVPRLAVCAVLVLTLAGAAFGGCAATRRTPVPTVLVGLWRGGAHGNGPWFYEFSADGGYRTWPERDPDTVNRGTIAVDGGDPGSGTLTFSNGGAPVTATWSVADGVLLLDGDRYLRN